MTTHLIAHNAHKISNWSTYKETLKDLSMLRQHVAALMANTLTSIWTTVKNVLGQTAIIAIRLQVASGVLKPLLSGTSVEPVVLNTATVTTIILMEMAKKFLSMDHVKKFKIAELATTLTSQQTNVLVASQNYALNAITNTHTIATHVTHLQF